MWARRGNSYCIYFVFSGLNLWLVYFCYRVTERGTKRRRRATDQKRIKEICEQSRNIVDCSCLLSCCLHYPSSYIIGVVILLLSMNSILHECTRISGVDLDQGVHESAWECTSNMRVNLEYESTLAWNMRVTRIDECTRIHELVQDVWSALGLWECTRMYTL